MSENAPITYEVEDGIATITIRRPDQRNALNKAARDGLLEAFGQFESDGSAHVAILTGEGDAFCSGADLKEMVATGKRVPGGQAVPHLGRSFHVSKPTIAMVNGIAYAGGFLLAQMCDLCTAADTAKFGLTEARWGRGAPWATPLIWMLPQRIMMEMLITAEPLAAQRAYELGFVNRIAPPDRLGEETMALARRIAACAPLSVKAGRAITYAATEMGRSAALPMGDLAFREAFMSEDALEGPRAFKEKRAPRWKGREP